MPPDPTAAGSLADQLEGPERERFERLRRAWHARVLPADEAERTETDSLAAQAWRGLRLDALEERVLKALLDGKPLDGLPTPQILLRWRARLERDGARAVERCNDARRLRPSPEAVREVEKDRLARIEAYLRALRAEPPPRAGAAATPAPGPLPQPGASHRADPARHGTARPSDEAARSPLTDPRAEAPEPRTAAPALTPPAAAAAARGSRAGDAPAAPAPLATSPAPAAAHGTRAEAPPAPPVPPAPRAALSAEAPRAHPPGTPSASPPSAPPGPAPIARGTALGPPPTAVSAA